MNKAFEVIELIQEQRGQGQGQGEPPVGDGGADTCVCPECGHKEPHEKGTPCNQANCPECDAPMTGESEKPKKKAPSKKGEPAEDSETTDRYDAFGNEEE